LAAHEFPGATWDRKGIPGDDRRAKSRTLSPQQGQQSIPVADLIGDFIADSQPAKLTAFCGEDALGPKTFRTS
jgi:hypothetical protein